MLWLQPVAQSSLLRLGDREFEQLNYVRAMTAYEAASNKSLRAYRNLANCYLALGKFEQAEACLKRVCGSSKRHPEDLWNYAKVLMRLGKYQAAKQVYNDFYRAAPRDLRAKTFKSAGDIEADLGTKAQNYLIKYMRFNTLEQDFGPAFYKKQLVFASTRRQYSPILREWNGNNRHFLDLFQTNPAQKSGKVIPFPGPFNKRFHEGPVTFNRDGTMCVLTRSNYDERDGQGKMRFGLYFSSFKDKQWTELQAFAYNDSAYSVGQASLSPDGKTMYFASDMPGGKGGTDIWVSFFKNKSWTKPKPHYPVNTAGDEMFPFYLESGVLLFASDGHVGLGGLDIFASKPKPDGTYKIRNLGSPVNSNADDFGMVTDPAMRRGFFTTNRPAPKEAEKAYGKRDSVMLTADDDIYSIQFLVPFDFGRMVAGQVIGEKDHPVEGVLIELQHVEKDIYRRALTTDEGTFVFNLDEVGDYVVRGSKTNYFDFEDTLHIDTLIEDYTPRLRIRRDPNISINLVITDSELGAPMAGVNLVVNNLETGKVTRHITDRGGTYRERLPQKRLHDSLSYVFKISRPGYLTKTLRFRTDVEEIGQYNVHKAKQGQRTLDFSMRRKTIGDDLALQLGILPFFFDTAKAQIAPYHTELLDIIAQSLLDNPDLSIEVVNHTDCRVAPGVNNQRLSEARADSIALYLIANVPGGAQRISSRGLGSGISKSACRCEGPRGNNCSPADYQVDRRTEFIITAID